MLIVDDEAMMIETIMRGLRRRQGHWDLHATTDSRLALTIIEAGELDLLVTDLQMPPPDRNQLIRSLRCHPRRIPIIVITGGELSESLSPLVDLVVHKPFVPPRLVAAIVELFDSLNDPATK